MKLLERIADILFPERLTCNICGREIFDGGYLCEECAKTVIFNDKATCPVCGRDMNIKKIKWRLLKERRYKWAVREMEMRFRYAKSKFNPVTPDGHFRRELWENWTGGTAV